MSKDGHMRISSKDGVLRRLEENSYLNRSTPPVTEDSSGDLRREQPTQSLPQSAVDKTYDALLDGNTHYVDVPGIEDLREALADHLNGSYGTEYTEGETLVTAGVQEARFLTIQKIGEQFDAIGLPEVVHPGVRRVIGVRDQDVHTIGAEQDRGYLPAVSDIRDALEQGCELLYLESPSRLSGAVYDTEEVEYIVDLLQSHDAYAIVDQGQAVWLPGEYDSLSAQTGISDRVALLGEAWPGKGLESLSIGYVATANDDWYEPMESEKQTISICTSTPSQFAALEVGSEFEETHPDQLQTFADAQSEAIEAATNAGLEPIAGDVVTQLAVSLSSTQRKRLEENGIEFVDGGTFGAPEVVRLAVTADGSTATAFKHLQ